jgi:hypothetical protein
MMASRHRVGAPPAAGKALPPPRPSAPKMALGYTHANRFRKLLHRGVFLDACIGIKTGLLTFVSGSGGSSNRRGSKRKRLDPGESIRAYI